MKRFAAGFGGAARKHAGFSHGISLNLTPMIDVMTIMLIFLVKSYSISPEYLTPAENLRLAQTKSEASAPDKAVLEIGEQGIRVAGQLVVAFKNGQPDARVLRQATIPSLQKALLKLKKDERYKGSEVLIIQADRALPFDYMKPLLRTAGASGFHDIKFAGLYED